MKPCWSYLVKITFCSCCVYHRAWVLTLMALYTRLAFSGWSSIAQEQTWLENRDNINLFLICYSISYLWTKSHSSPFSGAKMDTSNKSARLINALSTCNYEKYSKTTVASQNNITSSLSVHLFIHPSVSLRICLCVCLSVCLSVWLSVCLSICLSICPSVCMLTHKRQ